MQYCPPEGKRDAGCRAGIFILLYLFNLLRLLLFMETRARANCSFVCVHHPTITQPTYCTSLVEREKRKRFSLGTMHCPRPPARLRGWMRQIVALSLPSPSLSPKRRRIPFLSSGGRKKEDIKSKVDLPSRKLPS